MSTDTSPTGDAPREARDATHEQLLEEMAQHQHAAEREAARVTRRDMLLTALACLAWCVVGVGLIGWSMHTTDESWGRMAFALGIGAGNAGIIFTLLAAYRRGEQRGDW